MEYRRRKRQEHSLREGSSRRACGRVAKLVAVLTAAAAIG